MKNIKIYFKRPDKPIEDYIIKCLAELKFDSGLFRENNTCFDISKYVEYLYICVHKSDYRWFGKSEYEYIGDFTKYSIGQVIDWLNEELEEKNAIDNTINQLCYAKKNTNDNYKSLKRDENGRFLPIYKKIAMFYYPNRIGKSKTHRRVKIEEQDDQYLFGMDLDKNEYRQFLKYKMTGLKIRRENI